MFRAEPTPPNKPTHPTRKKSFLGTVGNAQGENPDKYRGLENTNTSSNPVKRASQVAHQRTPECGPDQARLSGTTAARARRRPDPSLRVTSPGVPRGKERSSIGSTLRRLTSSNLASATSLAPLSFAFGVSGFPHLHRTRGTPVAAEQDGRPRVEGGVRDRVCFAVAKVVVRCRYG